MMELWGKKLFKYNHKLIKLNLCLLNALIGVFGYKSVQKNILKRMLNAGPNVSK